MLSAESFPSTDLAKGSIGMVNQLAKYWWLLVIRGILSILFGIAVISWPGMSLAILILLFGIFSLVNGIILLIFGILSIARAKNWWFLVLEGVIDIIVGGFILDWPGLTLLLLASVAGFWLLLTGFTQLATAVVVRKEIENEWLLALGGVLSIVLGFVFIGRPIETLVVIGLMIGYFSLIAGVLQIGLGINLKGLTKAKKA